jgi:TonB family protein
MKKIALILTVILAATFCNNLQAQQQQETLPMSAVDEKPTFQGQHAAAFANWVYSQMKYPEQAIKENLEGRVAIKFTISKSGDLKDITVLRGAHPILDAEALRAVSTSPKWEPGKVKGEPVNVTYIFPVIFKMQKESEPAAVFDMEVIPAEFNSPYKKDGEKRRSSVEFTKWIFLNMNYPKEAIEKFITGEAKVAFDILADGTIDNVKIIKSAHPLLDEELVRVVKLSPVWQPATRHGKPVRSTYTLPFVFELR